ncbi:EmrB/QacA subfamily drug resistance transporter [Streptomyces phaeochromogenes]|uniref:MFS transporter n=1 Tax=Streptomyces phaeochromogenes TaxID=1923 RepID=UPI0027915359|nr:MFS transporter [Streptomyces phaeochromogenes]MDQ0948599.1 EmrB/QacA subfamily drug resistance transporter [Streptomyces phaeochromogenes]
MTQESPPHDPAHPGAQHHEHEIRPPVPHRWATLTLLCMAQFLLIVDVTVINVALPTVGDELALTAGQLTWAVTAYTLCFGSLLLLGGRAGDSVGRKRMFLAGLLVFTAASLVSGLAEDGGTLIAARAAQGVGAAMLSPAAMAIITSMFHGAERNRALGVWAAIGGSGAAFGVLLGGLLTTSLGWEWVFFINVPIGAAVFVCVAIVLKENAENSEGHRQDSPGGIDLAGALTMTAAPGLLIYGLVQARDHGFGSASSLLPLAGAVVCAGVFVAVEKSVRAPLVRLSVLTRRNLVGGSVVMLAASGVLISMFFLCSLYLQHVLGLSALKTGLVFLPVAVAITLAAHLSSQAIGRFGWRPVATTGFVLGTAGSLLLSRVEESGSAWTQVLPGFLLVAIGLGAGFVSATTSAMSDLPHEDMGLASGLVNTCHEMGAALGVAVVAAVAGASLETGGNSAPSVSGFDSAFLACAVISLGAAVAGALLLPRGRPDPSQGPVFAH